MKINNIWGECSGKLGGAVFSRNKGGAYIRRFVTPTNPNSQKQRAVRERFSTRTLEFRSLSPEIKSMWAEYVQTYYSPLTGSGRGNALNAFVSCRQAVDNCNQIAAQTTFDVPTEPIQPFVLPTLPPDKPLAANVVYGEKLVIPSILSVSYATGELRASIFFDKAPAPEGFQLINENGSRVSLNVYISSPSGGAYFSNPYRTLVLATGAARFQSIPDGKIYVSGSIILQPNFNYRATLVIMDENGQQMAIGTYDFNVPPNP